MKKEGISWPHNRPDWNDNMCMRSTDWVGLMLRVPGGIFQANRGADEPFAIAKPLSWRNEPKGWADFMLAVERELRACGMDNVHILGFERSKDWLDILTCPIENR
jgi:hypothetical protein